MEKTIVCSSLQSYGYKDELFLTEQGLILDATCQEQPIKSKSGRVRLTLENGKKVYRTIKSLYRQVYGREFAVDNIPDLEGEQWVAIDRRGKYFVSDFGRVKSYNFREAKLLKPYYNQSGYQRVDIRTNNRRRTYLVHQLVALAFVPNDNRIEKDTVDHIDLDKNNNKASNLRWLSRGDNVRAYQESKRKAVSGNE